MVSHGNSHQGESSLRWSRLGTGEAEGWHRVLAHSRGLIVSICKNLLLYWRVVNTFLIKLSHCSVEEKQTRQGRVKRRAPLWASKTPRVVSPNYFGEDWSLEGWQIRLFSRCNRTFPQLTPISCLNETLLRKSNNVGMLKANLTL